MSAEEILRAAFHRDVILGEIGFERRCQEEKHGDQSHLPNGTGPGLVVPTTLFGTREYVAEVAKARTDAASESLGNGSITFEHILTEEYHEALAESDDVKLRRELIQLAAVAVQWVEAIDKRRSER